MRLLILVSLLAAAFAAINVEFYGLDGRLADPCVNDASNRGSGDCTSAPPALPAAATTYNLPDIVTTPQLAQNVELKGRSFTNNAQIGFGTYDGGCAATSFVLNGGGTPTATVALPNPFITTATASADLSTLTFSFANLGAAQEVLLNSATANGRFSSTTALVTEAKPRRICYDASGTGAQWQWTGLFLAVVFNCAPGTSANQAQWCVNKPLQAYTSDISDAVQRGQTQCCSGNAQQIFRTSQCVNPNVRGCCGANAYDLGYQKCCNESVETVAWIDGTCPCKRNTVYPATVITGGAAHPLAGQSFSYCPSGELCCTQSKFPELVPADLTQAGTTYECYDPRKERCCDTGNKYDPGTQQCCSINGLQSINVQCPCSSKADCIGGQVGYRQLDLDCCIQTAPPLNVITTLNTAGKLCSKYNNYPSGTGAAANQGCLGKCIDTRYQICCNGIDCIRNFERCCNASCCNRYTQSCQSGTRRQGSSKVNFVEVDVGYDVCTTVENIDLIRAWWMFVLPTWCLIWTLLALALALVFAGRVERQSLKALEKGMILLALISALFATCLYFAPLYKYGLVIVFVSVFTILTAAIRSVGMYISCIGLHIVLIIYLIDPFHGNDYLTLAIDRLATGRADPMTAGLWHSTSRIWDNPGTCHTFYNGYFKFDTTIRDLVRFDEPNNPSFGYCSRGWVSAMLVFDGFIIISVITNFFLIIIALLIRARMLKKAEEVVWQP